jgi:hypothetical protein
MATESQDLGVRYADRGFQLWAFTISHGQLLLRSPRGHGGPTRVDVLFKPVRSMNLPTRMDGLCVERVQDGRFRVSGTNWAGEVLADFVCASEDDLGDADPSALYLGGIGA